MMVLHVDNMKTIISDFLDAPHKSNCILLVQNLQELVNWLFLIANCLVNTVQFTMLSDPGLVMFNSQPSNPSMSAAAKSCIIQPLSST